MTELMTPSISVIIPSYNSEKTLSRAINSVLSQNFPVLEILVIDDGSTDGTRNLIEKEFPQVRYIYQNNQGASAARNNGATVAQGEWLALLDADDLWKPGKLAKQWDIIQSHPDSVFITTGREFAHQRKIYNGSNIYRWRIEQLLAHNRVHTSSVMVKREIFQSLGGFDPGLVTGEDWDLWLRIVHRYPAYGTTKRLITRYRVKGSLSEDRYRICQNNIIVLNRWDPRNHPDVSIRFATYRKIIWWHTFKSCKRIQRLDKTKANAFWEESLHQLPFSSAGRHIIEKLLNLTQDKANA